MHVNDARLALRGLDAPSLRTLPARGEAQPDALFDELERVLREAAERDDGRADPLECPRGETSPTSPPTSPSHRYSPRRARGYVIH